MTTTTENTQTAGSASPKPGEMRLEVVVLPVADTVRSRDFYVSLGWRLDADLEVEDGYRVVQVTPPGSGCSVIFGAGVSAAEPGSAQGLHLVVYDIEQTRAELVRHDVPVSEIFHDVTGIFHQGGTTGRAPGPAAARASYGSFASFTDPDGNGWVLQEVRGRGGAA